MEPATSAKIPFVGDSFHEEAFPISASRASLQMANGELEPALCSEPGQQTGRYGHVQDNAENANGLRPSICDTIHPKF